MIEELTITQDIDRILPIFRMRLKDSTGNLGEIIPFDKELNLVSIRVSRSNIPSNLNEFNFKVKRRRATFEKMYEVEGILNVDELISPNKERALSGSIKSSLEDLANTDLKISESEVSASLDYEKVLIQPNWNNMTFLRWLKGNLIGKNNETCFYCFVKNIRGSKVFVFKNIGELNLAPIQHKVIIGYKHCEDYIPVVDFEVFDNSQVITDFGALSQLYSYFDYTNGRLVESSASTLDCPSLSELFLVDKDNTSQNKMINLGRSNSFTSNFKGRVEGNFFDRLNGLIQMWISTWGLENVSPGDIVKVVFSEALERANLFIYQHSGYWMVKRVVHIIGQSFMTNLLLSRCGIDTDLSTSLLEATKVRKSG